MKKLLVPMFVAVIVAAVGYSISEGGPVLVPSLMKFGANGTVTLATGDCVSILAYNTAGTTATDTGVPCMQPGTVIASLPTCNAAATGMRTWVTNGVASPTFTGAVSTTGAVVDPVFCNGTGWVYD